MTTKKLNAEAILQKLAELRKSMPHLDDVPTRPASDGRLTAPHGFPLETAEELARDPEHADLIPFVERMREAYQHDHGRPIPPRKS